jgi:hypothetical protein
MNHPTTRRAIKWGLLLLVVAALSFIGWQVIFKRPFVQVVLPEGTDTVQLRQVIGGQAKTTTATKTSSLRLPIGGYDATYYKDKRVVGLSHLNVKPAFKQTLSGTVTPPTNKLSTFMHDHAKRVTPLGSGYIFQDTQTRGISYVDAAGAQDISASFLLSQRPQDPDNPDADYNTVINIQPAKEGVVVTTTAAVFLAKSPGDVTRLPSYDKEFLYFTSSSYDAKTNRLFALSAYKTEVFYYDLGNPEQGPKVVYTAGHNVNRVAAGGGKAAVYFDDVPSVNPDVLNIYAKTRQLAPVIFDGSTGKVEKTLDDWQGTTLLTISPDGNYAALKKKFATDMSVIELAGSKSFTVPAPDAGASAWKGSSLYFGRDKGLWSIDPAASGNKVIYVAPADDSFNQLLVSGESVTATTTTGFVQKLVPANGDVGNQTTEKLKGLALKTNGYFISYADFGGTTMATVETQGNFMLGIEETALAASQGPEYQKAVDVIRSVPNGSAVVIKQKDNSIIRLYQYAGIPADS